MINVMIVDDQDLVREAIAGLLEDQPNIKVIAKAESGEEAIRLAREKNPDVILMDIKMPPGIDGIQATHKILTHNPDIKVIALTAYINDPFPSFILKAGAKGFLTKKSEPEKMVQAIRDVASGKTYIDPDVAQKLALRNLPGNKSPFDSLSGRELNVLMMITSGVSAQSIAKSLFLSPKTVNTYRQRIFQKLEVKNDVELTLYGIQHGLIERDGT